MFEHLLFKRHFSLPLFFETSVTAKNLRKRMKGIVGYLLGLGFGLVTVVIVLQIGLIFTGDQLHWKTISRLVDLTWG